MLVGYKCSKLDSTNFTLKRLFEPVEYHLFMLRRFDADTRPPVLLLSWTLTKALLKSKKLQKCHITELSPAVGNRLLDKSIKLVLLREPETI